MAKKRVKAKPRKKAAKKKIHKKKAGKRAPLAPIQTGVKKKGPKANKQGSGKQTGPQLKFNGKPVTGVEPLSDGPDAGSPEDLRLNKIRSARRAAYVQYRMDGVHKGTAVKLAGYDPKNARNANAIACQLDRMLLDKGVMLDALIEAGVNQVTLAVILFKALHNEDDRIALQAARTVISILNYDQQIAETDPEDPEEIGAGFDQKRHITTAVSGAITASNADSNAR
jgi:hypothetical protein